MLQETHHSFEITSNKLDENIDPKEVLSPAKGGRGYCKNSLPRGRVGNCSLTSHPFGSSRAYAMERVPRKGGGGALYTLIYSSQTGRADLLTPCVISL